MEENMHVLTMENREKLTVTAVSGVKSFNSNEIVLLVKGSKLYIKGNELKVENVSKEKGEVDITASVISSVTYSKDSVQTEGFFGRMFK